MDILTVKEVVSATGGELLCGDVNTRITSVCIDSRAAYEGALFVPIIGERIDAHRFIGQVFENNAAAVLTSHGEIINPDKVHIKVEDTIKALRDLAFYYRSKFDLPVIGITGSVGKTSTKEMVAAALASKFNVLKTAGNQNSQIGVPLTLFRIESRHQIAVVEMGISEFGEMDNLVNIVKPDAGIITNIGVAHIAQLGSQHNIMKEKLKITRDFSDSNLLYLNGNDPLLLSEAASLGQGVRLFGTDAGLDYCGVNIEVKDGKQYFDFEYPGGSERIAINQLGIHNVNNAVVALAIALQYGVSPKIAKCGLADYKGIAMRQQIYHLNKGIKVIDDTYNASPDSIISGIEILEELDNSGKKIAVLGDILELGDLSWQCHYDTGAAAAKKRIDEVVTVGSEMKAFAKAVTDTNAQIIVHAFKDKAQVIEYLKKSIGSQAALLVKGSRGMHMEEIVEALKNIIVS